DDNNREIARITFFSVFAQIRQFERDAVFRRNLAGFPDHFVESLDTAVQMVLAVVDGQFVLHSIERKSPFGDAVGVTARERAEKRMAFQVLIQGIEAEYNVVQLAFAVRSSERNDNAAVGDDPGLDAVRVRQRVKLNALPVRCLSEIFLLQGRFPLSAETTQKNDGRA